MYTLRLFFDWPKGEVWGNIIAWGFTTVPAITVSYFKLRNQRERHHSEDNRQFEKLHKQLGEGK